MMEYLGLALLLCCLLAYGLYNGYDLFRELRDEKVARSKAIRLTSRTDEKPSKPVTREDIVKQAQELRENGWTVELADDHLSLMAHKPLHPR